MAESKGQDPNATNQSRLNHYQGCPRSYYLQKIAKVPTQRDDVPWVGIATHQIAEIYGTILMAEGLQSDLASIPQTVEDGLTGHTKKDHDRIPAKFHAEVRSFMIPWLENFFVKDPTKLVGIEETLEFSDGDMTIMGTIDRLELWTPKAIVTDWKSSWVKISEGDLKMSLQTRFYAILTFLKFPKVKEVQVNFEYPRLSAATSATFYREDLDEMIETIRPMVRELTGMTIGCSDKEDAWAITPGSWCAWCEVKGDCPMFNDALRLYLDNGGPIQTVITRPDHARDVAEAIVLMEEHLKSYKAALKLYTAEHGFVNVSGLAFGHHKSESKSFDAGKIYQLIADGEDELIPFLSINSRKKMKAELFDVVSDADAVEIKTKTAFKSKKI